MSGDKAGSCHRRQCPLPIGRAGKGPSSSATTTCQGDDHPIAVGPFGMTGTRITTTLLNSLQFHDAQFGLETMCVGGGLGMALILERLS
jgi:hypothetical protein